MTEILPMKHVGKLDYDLHCNRSTMTFRETFSACLRELSVDGQNEDGVWETKVSSKVIANVEKTTETVIERNCCPHIVERLTIFWLKPNDGGSVGQELERNKLRDMLERLYPGVRAILEKDDILEGPDE